MAKKKSNLKSVCCNAEIKYSEIAPDFVRDNPQTMTVGTVSCLCTKCGEPCNIYLKKRKTWKINPKTRIIPNKKKKSSTKLTTKELKEIKENEDF